MIREIQSDGQTLHFVADDQGMPVSFGYPNREQAEQVEQLIEASDGKATIPEGVDIAGLLFPESVA